MVRLIFLLCIGAVTCLAIIFGISENAVRRRCLDFIEGINPLDGQRIYNAILKYRSDFPVAWFTALIWGESCFDPLAYGADNDKGLGQLTPLALREVERVYGIEVDETRLFEIEYNIYLTGLFAERCKAAAAPYAEGKYNILYATIMIYKDWLTWNEWTHTKALRTWERYQGLKHNYLTHNYESERV